MARRFKPPWSTERIPGGYVVQGCDRPIARLCLFSEKANDAHMAKVLTEDEARRIASNIAKLPTLLRKPS